MNSLKQIFGLSPAMKQACVIGCGRAGTSFTTRLINDVLGITCAHEVKRSWAAVDVSWKLTTDPNIRDKYRYVLHQVREPLDCIASLQTIAWHTHFRKRRFAGVPDLHPKNSALANSIVYWYQWNKLAESVSDFRYTIESMNAGDRETIGRFCECLDIMPDDYYGKIVQFCSQNRTINRREHGAVTWALIQDALPEYHRRIVEMATRYGYDTSDLRKSA